MNEREYERLKRKIEAEYRRQLEALETIWRLAQQQGGDQPQRTRAGRGRLLSAVREAVVQSSGNFRVEDIAAEVERANPDLGQVKRSSVSSTLKRLQQSGEVTVIEPGSGKRGSVFARGRSKLTAELI